VAEATRIIGEVHLARGVLFGDWFGKARATRLHGGWSMERSFLLGDWFGTAHGALFGALDPE
jgi:hypothetical protein